MSDTTANDLAPSPARPLAAQPGASGMLRGVTLGARNFLAQPAVAKSLPLIGFEATLQVRNRLLSAYKDIMSMPV